MDPPISSGASVHLISGWDEGRNMIRLISSGFSLGPHLVINKGFPKVQQSLPSLGLVRGL